MSSKIRAGLIGVGAAVPEKILTNADLEKMVDTNDEWITTRTGIKQRHIAAPGEAASDYAIKAGKIAMERAGITAEDLDLIIIATITADSPLPACASIVQDKLGATHAAAFDLQAGCTGWVYALSVARNFVENGAAKNVLAVGVDLLSTITNWTDRTTCVLFGDGAGAGIVSAMKDDEYGFYDFVLGSDGSGAPALSIEAGGSRVPITHEALDEHRNKVVMNGREVFKFAVKVQGDAAELILNRAGLSMEDVDLVVPHQANVRIIESAVKRLGIPEEKFYVNIPRFGNTSAASIPIALNEAVEAGRVKKGDNILLVGFGAGLTWGAGVMKWAY